MRNIPVSAAERIAKAYDYDQVMIIARKDADVFGSGFLAVSADGILRRLNPIGVRIDELEAMKP